MRSRFVPLFTLSAILVLVPTASAHITVTADQPAIPLPLGTPSTVDVTIAISCATLVSEYNGAAELKPAVAPGAPAYITTSGETASFDATSDCVGPALAGSAEKSVKLTITPGADVPGLQVFNITVGAMKADGTEMEGGDMANVNLSYEYMGTLEVIPPNTTAFTPEHGDRVSFTLSFSVKTNSLSMIMLMPVESPASGKIPDLPATVDVQPPSVDGLSVRTIDVPLTYNAPDTEWGTDNFTLDAQLMSYADPTKVSPPARLAFNFTHVPDEADGAQGEGDGKSPAPDLALLLGAVAVGVFVWRRRDAA